MFMVEHIDKGSLDYRKPLLIEIKAHTYYFIPLSILMERKRLSNILFEYRQNLLKCFFFLHFFQCITHRGKATD